MVSLKVLLSISPSPHWEVIFFTKLPTRLEIQVVHPIVKTLGEFKIASFCFYGVGNSIDVTKNLECTGRYSFIHFKASAVCFTNPLMTGRYVGIMTTKSQVLQLCEVEIYSRGNSGL